MAKKGGSHQSKSAAEKKATTKKNKEKHIFLNEQKREENKPIDAFIESRVLMTTIDLVNLVMGEFNISKNRAQNRIKKVRKKLKVYNLKSDEFVIKSESEKSKKYNKSKSNVVSLNDLL